MVHSVQGFDSAEDFMEIDMTEYAINALGYRVALTGGGTEARAESFRQLCDDGFDRSSCARKGLPTGSRRVVLERKLWTRAGSGLTCFFLDQETAERYQVTVFRDRASHEYLAGDLDIAGTPYGSPLEVLIHENKTGTFRINEARTLKSG